MDHAPDPTISVSESRMQHSQEIGSSSSSSAASSGHNLQKLRRNQVAPDTDTEGDDKKGIMISGTTSSDQKEKVPALTKSSRDKKKAVMEDDDIQKNFDGFKQFDIIQTDNHGKKDHYYYNPDPQKAASGNVVTKLLNKLSILVEKPPKSWVKKVQQEWRILEKDLPDSIFVRVYEDRMDLLRAVIIGPAGTPYRDGLFFFDVHFPPSYPDVPPMVHYHSHGYRLNPNLYACGKVCLSLLGTWSGKGCEKWQPEKSTILQVLVSIQGLVLNEDPYYNEPTLQSDDEDDPRTYNDMVFLLSCKTMMFTLRNPPKHFEDFIIGHFRKHGGAIMAYNKEWKDKAFLPSQEGDEEIEAYNKKIETNINKLADYIKYYNNKKHENPQTDEPPRLSIEKKSP